MDLAKNRFWLSGFYQYEEGNLNRRSLGSLKRQHGALREMVGAEKGAGPKDDWVCRPKKHKVSFCRLAVLWAVFRILR
jgi:hypothetical protein